MQLQYSICISFNQRKDVTHIARRYDSEGARRRILSSCVRLFIERGYRETTMVEILREADVSASTFQNIFKNKSGVLLALARFMFENQFATAREIVGENAAPSLFYAVETALQLALAEANESIRENYLEAYAAPDIIRYINQEMAENLHALFARYLPDASLTDFYQIEIGTSGMIRAYMYVPCDQDFPLEQKIRRFLEMSLLAYSIPEDERRVAIDYVAHLDIRHLADDALSRLFKALAVRFQFTFSGER